jgi:ubiquinone/menaquinone biosynthesis C-methylase UbiE
MPDYDRIQETSEHAESARSDSWIDHSNSSFWNELCGSALARVLGITDASPQSLKRFDDWYFGFYPYLLPFVNASGLAGRRALEVGLGYGSLSQKVAEAGADYTGLDIAAGPVAMVNHRLRQSGLPGRAVEGSVLKCPFPDHSFDVSIAIGSLHHTGDLGLALSELRRVLVPGGQLVFMVYNALSYRRWLRWPLATMRHALWVRGALPTRPSSSESERRAYDADSEGNAAPETVFCARGELRSMMKDWSINVMQLENIGDEGLLRLLSRSLKLKAMGPWTGLDIYVRATRPS